MEEIWKDIHGYEGLYKVSNFGQVYSVKRKKLLKLINSHHGELDYIQILTNGKRLLFIDLLLKNLFQTQIIYQK